MAVGRKCITKITRFVIPEANMPIVTSTIKGQIVIPAKIRAKFKIRKGTQVNVYVDGNRIIVEPLTHDPVEEGWGMLKTRGKILKALVEDRQKEAEL